MQEEPPYTVGNAAKDSDKAAVNGKRISLWVRTLAITIFGTFSVYNLAPHGMHYWQILAIGIALWPGMKPILHAWGSIAMAQQHHLFMD